jgi:hypothetical protein
MMWMHLSSSILEVNLGCSFLHFTDLVRWSGSINWNRILVHFGKTAQRSSDSPLNGRYRDPYLHAGKGTEVYYMLLCCCPARDSDQLYLRLCWELSRLGVFY